MRAIKDINFIFPVNVTLCLFNMGSIAILLKCALSSTLHFSVQMLSSGCIQFYPIIPLSVTIMYLKWIQFVAPQSYLQHLHNNETLAE